VEQRHDNGRHACRLSENAWNLNRRNTYEVLGSHRPVAAVPWRNQYAVTGDGQRFLLDEPLEDVYAHAPITVITNWMAATLKK
jgi:hypothetical protein